MSVQLITSILTLVIIFLIEGISPYFKGRRGRIRHALPNVTLGGLNGLISGFVFAGFTIVVINWSQVTPFGFVNVLKLPFYAKGIIAFIIFDLWMYAWHRANHRVSFLWRFHRVHHTDPEMDTTTAFRFHPVEIVFSSLLRLIVLPLIGLDLIHLLIYEMSMQPIILFHHSNVGLPERWDRLIRSIIVTPNMHRVHHSQEGFEFNSNYASVFSFWDRLFQTFKKRDDTLTIKFGLRILQESRWQKLWGMLISPFK